MKKIYLVLAVLGLGCFVASCGKTTTTTTQATTTTTTTQATTTTTTKNNDTLAPVFKDLVDGKIVALSHLKGETVDFLKGLRAIDNVTETENVVISIKDFGGYDKDVVGTYTLTYAAKDEAGNESTVERLVTVKPTVIKSYPALVINDVAVPYIGEGKTGTIGGEEYTIDKAFVSTSLGISCGRIDQLTLLSYAKFQTLFAAAQASGQWENNGNDPFMSYGALVALDSNYSPVYLRLSKGAAMEVLPSNDLVYGEEASFSGTAAAKTKAGLLANLDTTLAGFVANGTDVAYVGIVGNPTGGAEDFAITKLINGVFWTEYVKGAVYKDNRDIESIVGLKGEINDDYKLVVEKPANLEAPTFTIEKSAIKFTGIDGAKEYLVYVDGLATTFTIANLGAGQLHEVSLIGANGLGLEAGTYQVSIQAITKDYLKWSDSDVSEAVTYVQEALIAIKTAPVIAVNGDNLEWEAVEGAASYDVYVNVTGVATKVFVGNTTNTSYAIAGLKETYKNFVSLYVVAVGDETHANSSASNQVVYDFANVKPLAIDGFEYKALATTWEDYFSRRNETYNLGSSLTGYSGAPYIFLLENFGEYKNSTDATLNALVKEVFSTVVLLDKDNSVKYVNNIFNNFVYKNGQWEVVSTTPAGNTDNLAGIKDVLAATDKLLVFKNGNTMTIFAEDGVSTLKVGIRHIGAHHFVANSETYNTLDSTTAWKTTDATKLVDPSQVEVSFLASFTEKLAKPVLTLNKNTGVINWETVDGAIKYVLTINKEEIELDLTVNTFDITTKVTNWQTEGFTATLKAVATNKNSSSVSDELVVLPSALVITPKADTILVNLRDYIDPNDATDVPDPYDFLADITATENGQPIETVEVVEGEFEVIRAGIYVVTFKVTSSEEVRTLDITYVVEDNVSVHWSSMTVGENTSLKKQAYCHPTHNIFENTSWVLNSGAERLHVYNHIFFNRKYSASALVSSGVVLVYNHKMELQLFRCTTGSGDDAVTFEILKDGTVKTTDLSWNTTTGNGLLTGVKELLATLPHGGYVCLAPGGANRTFIFQNLLGATTYSSGIFTTDYIQTNPYTVEAKLNITAQE